MVRAKSKNTILAGTKSDLTQKSDFRMVKSKIPGKIKIGNTIWTF
jgi:hypothetical protein